jgi:hypothetical protein
MLDCVNIAVLVQGSVEAAASGAATAALTTGMLHIAPAVTERREGPEESDG